LRTTKKFKIPKLCLGMTKSLPKHIPFYARKRSPAVVFTTGLRERESRCSLRGTGMVMVGIHQLQFVFAAIEPNHRVKELAIRIARGLAEISDFGPC
jgi:hypothetical protein